MIEGYVCAYQHDWLLDAGPKRPLRQLDAAEALGVSQGSVSRAVAQRDLGELFDVPYSDAVSRDAVREWLRRVTAHDGQLVEYFMYDGASVGHRPVPPLSDDELARWASAELGIEISRRSISKFRAQLAIPPSHARSAPKQEVTA